MYDQIAQAHPKLQRARVWCDTCNRTVKVNVSTCLQHGWPKCCGYTMTLDSPEERAAGIVSQEEDG